MSLASQIDTLATRIASEIKAIRTFQEVFSIPGTLVVATGVSRLLMPRAGTVTNVWASINTAPTGASAIFDVNKNGTTIFTTQSARPTIAVSTNSDATSTPAVTSFSAGDYFTVDVDQIGSTVAGSNAVIGIEFKFT